MFGLVRIVRWLTALGLAAGLLVTPSSASTQARLLIGVHRASDARGIFGLSNGYWLRAQAAYDTEVAQESLAAALDRIKPWSETARSSSDRQLPGVYPRSLIPFAVSGGLRTPSVVAQ